jgi:hypothetical protein
MEMAAAWSGPELKILMAAISIEPTAECPHGHRAWFGIRRGALQHLRAELFGRCTKRRWVAMWQANSSSWWLGWSQALDFHPNFARAIAHRLAVLAQIKACLKAGLDCRVLSTQVVEWGVDIDFPD